MPKPLSTKNPFEKNEVSDILFGEGNQWVGYTFGVCFIIIGILLFTRIPKAQRKANKYKEEQLKEYKIQNPKSKNIDYKSTKMFLPAWERVKLFAPTFFGILFIVVGIAWVAGNSLTVL